MESSHLWNAAPDEGTDFSIVWQTDNTQWKIDWNMFQSWVFFRKFHPYRTIPSAQHWAKASEII